MFFMIIILFFLALIVNDNAPSKYDALEKILRGNEEKEIKEFEYKKSPLHTIFYGCTST